jgi:hypothetical protein
MTPWKAADWRGLARRVVLAVAVAACGGCALGPKALECSHGKYNEAVKTSPRSNCS